MPQRSRTCAAGITCASTTASSRSIHIRALELAHRPFQRALVGDRADLLVGAEPALELVVEPVVGPVADADHEGADRGSARTNSRWLAGKPGSRKMTFMACRPPRRGWRGTASASACEALERRLGHAAVGGGELGAAARIQGLRQTARRTSPVGLAPASPRSSRSTSGSGLDDRLVRPASPRDRSADAPDCHFAARRSATAQNIFFAVRVPERPLARIPK